MSTALVILNNIPAMSACSFCPKPGMCCSGFPLASRKGELTFWAADPIKDAKKMLLSWNLPFNPTKIRATYSNKRGWKYVTLLYSCPKLKEDGRCGIYEFRPDVCRRFIPGQGEICYFDKLI